MTIHSVKSFCWYNLVKICNLWLSLSFVACCLTSVLALMINTAFSQREPVGTNYSSPSTWATGPLLDKKFHSVQKWRTLSLFKTGLELVCASVCLSSVFWGLPLVYLLESVWRLFIPNEKRLCQPCSDYVSALSKATVFLVLHNLS